MTIAASLRDHVFADDAAGMLDLYLNRGRFSGAWYDTIGGPGDAPEVADWFTPADVAAVSTLSINVPGWAAIELLDRCADELHELLAQIPASVELHAASDDDVTAVYAIQERLDPIDDIGPVTRSKLLARKRPHLVPLRDQHVMRALMGREHGTFTEPLRDALAADSSVRAQLDALRAEAGHPGLSLIRTLDVVVWMRSHGAQSIA